jgi:hypothetical protein
MMDRAPPEVVADDAGPISRTRRVIAPCQARYVADSDAVRSRRKRLHGQGDHSECRRCGARRAVLTVPVLQETAEGHAGTPEGPVDAQASLEGLARRLEAAHVASPGDAMLARVLKDVLLALGATPARADDGELGAILAAIRS